MKRSRHLPGGLILLYLFSCIIYSCNSGLDTVKGSRIAMFSSDYRPLHPKLQTKGGAYFLVSNDTISPTNYIMFCEDGSAYEETGSGYFCDEPLACIYTINNDTIEAQSFISFGRFVTYWMSGKSKYTITNDSVIELQNGNHPYRYVFCRTPWPIMIPVSTDCHDYKWMWRDKKQY